MSDLKSQLYITLLFYFLGERDEYMSQSVSKDFINQTQNKLENTLSYKKPTEYLTLACSHFWKSRSEWNVQKSKQTKRDRLPRQFLQPLSSYSTFSLYHNWMRFAVHCRDWLAVHFLLAQNRNTPFPSFYHFIKICGASLFTAEDSHSRK